MKPTSSILSYHAHVYYDADSKDRARAVIDAACAQFNLVRGKMHEMAVGPHPMWSCQLEASPDVFAGLLPWLALNRDGLIVFSHPDTGDVMADHRDHAIWLGGYPDLRLDFLERHVAQSSA